MAQEALGMKLPEEKVVKKAKRLASAFDKGNGVLAFDNMALPVPSDMKKLMMIPEEVLESHKRHGSINRLILRTAFELAEEQRKAEEKVRLSSSFRPLVSRLFEFDLSPKGDAPRVEFTKLGASVGNWRAKARLWH